MGFASQYRENIDNFIVSKILPVGLLVFLTFNFLVLSRSSYKTFVYILLFLPVLLLYITTATSQLEVYRKSIGLKLLAMFLFYMALSATWASSTDDVNYLKRAAYIIFFVTAWLRYPSFQNVFRLLDVATIVATVAVLIYIYDFYWLDDMQFKKRISGGNALINPLLSGSFVGVFLSYCLLRLLQVFGRNKLSVVFILALIPLMAFVWLTGSRTPLLAIVAVVLIQPFYYQDDKKIWSVIAITLIGLVIMYLGWDRILSRGFSLRFDIWFSIIESWREVFWLGNGMGSAISIAVDNRIFVDPHNYHLAAGYYGGLVGFILWIGCLIWAAKSALTCTDKPYARIAIALLLYGFIASSFDGSSFIGRPNEVWFILWLPLALCFKAEFDSKIQIEKKDITVNV